MMWHILPLMALIVSLGMFGCGESSDIDVPGVCEAHGVVEQNKPLGQLREIHELPDSQIIKICGPSKWVGRVNVGCVKPNGDGTVNVYYRTGDNCTKIHEFCHARHGLRHTPEYISDLAKGFPRPTCPK